MEDPDPRFFIRWGVGASVVALALAFVAAWSIGPCPPIEARGVLNVSRDVAWNTLKDLPKWGTWSKVFKVEGLNSNDPEPGQSFRIQCTWHDGSVDWSDERITQVTSNEKLCWEFTALPSVLLNTDRCIVLSSKSDDTTNILNYLTFRGVLGPIVYFLMSNKVKLGFEHFNEDFAKHLVSKSQPQN